MNLKLITKKNKGFASITLLLFLPLMCLLIFSFSFSAYLIQFKTKMRSVCISESIVFQKNLIQNEEELFKLNPEALLLRQQLQIKQAQLLAAMATENIPLIAKLKIEISEIQTLQKKLDSLQKSIILKTKTQMSSHIHSILLKLNQISQKTKSIWSYYIQSFTTLQIEKVSQLSLRADRPDLAPVYELADNYIEQQRLAFSWQHFYQTTRNHQSFVNEKNEIEMGCGTRAKKLEENWDILINADKF